MMKAAAPIKPPINFRSVEGDVGSSSVEEGVGDGPGVRVRLRLNWLSLHIITSKMKDRVTEGCLNSLDLATGSNY